MDILEVNIGMKRSLCYYYLANTLYITFNQGVEMKARNVMSAIAMMMASVPAMAAGNDKDAFSDFAMAKHERLHDQHVNGVTQDVKTLSAKQELTNGEDGMKTAMYRVAKRQNNW